MKFLYFILFSLFKFFLNSSISLKYLFDKESKSLFIINLKADSIHLKNILQTQREIKYDSDNNFLLDISKITINFSESDPDLQNLPFCYSYQKFINKYKNTLREEKFLIFTSIFQI